MWTIWIKFSIPLFSATGFSGTGMAAGVKATGLGVEAMGAGLTTAGPGWEWEWQQRELDREQRTSPVQISTVLPHICSCRPTQSCFEAGLNLKQSVSVCQMDCVCQSCIVTSVILIMHTICFCVVVAITLWNDASVSEAIQTPPV